jgi:hypothetical protein
LDDLLKDRYFISARKPVSKLGQLVVGDIIGESCIRTSRLEECFKVRRLFFATRKKSCNHPSPNEKSYELNSQNHSYLEEISLYKVMNWLKRDNKIGTIIIHGLSCKFMMSLIHEIPKTLCKDIRKRKTTQTCLEQGVSFEDLYAEYIKNKKLIAA